MGGEFFHLDRLTDGWTNVQIDIARLTATFLQLYKCAYKCLYFLEFVLDTQRSHIALSLFLSILNTKNVRDTIILLNANSAQNNESVLNVKSVLNTNGNLKTNSVLNNFTYRFTDRDDVKSYDIYGVTIGEVEVDILTGQHQVSCLWNLLLCDEVDCIVMC